MDEDLNLISDDDVLHIACKVEILDSPDQLHVGDNSIIAYPLKRRSSLPSDMQKLFNDDTFSDVTLAVDRVTFKVHRAILAARSPVFKRMFSNEMKEKNEGIVDISDYSADVLEQMLMFIYTGHSPYLQEHVDELLSAANQ